LCCFQNDKIPWVDILTSLPVNALNVCNFARSFVFFMLLTNEPAYLNVFNYNLAEVSVSYLVYSFSVSIKVRSFCFVNCNKTVPTRFGANTDLIGQASDFRFRSVWSMFNDTTIHNLSPLKHIQIHNYSSIQII